MNRLPGNEALRGEGTEEASETEPFEVLRVRALESQRKEFKFFLWPQPQSLHLKNGPLRWDVRPKTAMRINWKLCV